MITKIFCDIADLTSIKKFHKKKIVKGFTTNPSLMRKAGAKDYKSYCKKILKICKKKPISFEVFGDNYTSMMKQALKINTWGKNVYVKGFWLYLLSFFLHLQIASKYFLYKINHYQYQHILVINFF